MIKVLINERYCKCSIGILCARAREREAIIRGASPPIIILSLLMSTRNINYEKDVKFVSMLRKSIFRREKDRLPRFMLLCEKTQFRGARKITRRNRVFAAVMSHFVVTSSVIK